LQTGQLVDYSTCGLHDLWTSQFTEMFDGKLEVKINSKCEF